MLVQQPVSAGESSASASGAASRRQVVMASIEVYETLGGGGLYALIGARLWLGANQLATLVNREQRRTDGSGGDLPRRLEKELEGYGRDMWVWNEGKGTRMTRARIRYEGDVRLYQHIVKAPYRPLSSLLHTPLALAEYLHVSPPYSPEDLHGLLVELDAQNDRGDESNRPWRPKIVFEPTPPSCHAGQKEWLEKILGGIEVLSPNHEELLSFYSIPPIRPTDPALLPMIESLIVHLLSLGVGPDGSGAVVVRCGRLGCVVGTREGGVRWIPAYWAAQDEGRVKDVTGAGNSFLGGYISGLSLSSGDPYETALYATVSASFVVEQFGLPVLNPVAERRSEPEPSDGEEQGDGGVHERWNGDSPWNRLVSLRARLGVA
ncbi:hypothetical protein EHS25_001833 [Saitozyma podzolica]|uniref:Carbohydrate kinase PfkB domain-containing protein n=1 Tax=Saitozyma podzolica TaxID=1890683 RepID=A0A427YFT1_9TREE|nr:hypothetical protein EHS25_001833 [Saitozyma podzolica]